MYGLLFQSREEHLIQHIIKLAVVSPKSGKICTENYLGDWKSHGILFSKIGMNPVCICQFNEDILFSLVKV